MGARLNLWIPSFVLGHILGLVFLLYALEKINGSLTRLGKLISRVTTSRGRTKDAPSPSSEAAAANTAAGAGSKGAALAKERAASIKQTSLYADDGLNSNADGAANGDGIDSDGGANPAATTPRRALLPRWNRACKCEVSFHFLFFTSSFTVLALRIAIAIAAISPLCAGWRRNGGGKARARLRFRWGGRLDWRAKTTTNTSRASSLLPPLLGAPPSAPRLRALARSTRGRSESLRRGAAIADIKRP